MSEKIIEFFIQLGIGSIIGVIIGMLFQYFISKKLKIHDTKLIIFRRLYKQLYYVILMYHEEFEDLEKNCGIDASKVIKRSGLDLTKDLGDALYFVDGELEKMISSLIYTLHQGHAIIGKSSLDNMKKIMKKLKHMKRK